MNPYIGGGYGAAAGLLGVYAVYVRRRVRVLTKALPPEEIEVTAPAGDEPGSGPA